MQLQLQNAVSCVAKNLFLELFIGPVLFIKLLIKKKIIKGNVGKNGRINLFHKCQVILYVTRLSTDASQFIMSLTMQKHHGNIGVFSTDLTEISKYAYYIGLTTPKVDFFSNRERWVINSPLSLSPLRLLVFHLDFWFLF